MYDLEETELEQRIRKLNEAITRNHQQRMRMNAIFIVVYIAMAIIILGALSL